MAHKSANINIKNKRAYFEYEILEKFVAGLQLVGTEIKSIRNSKASIVEAYCRFQGSELWVVNMNISEYDFGNINNHEARRDRKLLLNKKELEKLQKKIKESGFTIVPLRLFMNDRGLAKLEVGLARGKKLHDKRESLKSKDAKRDIDRAMKY
ncbi:SsrA-binding protein SmpB [Mangrovibacterium marinum]|uniref:SsrA-binding protein n=1 Tax=Mangrovibacterium marinum TaxID=1639118 RepID=A0A2T5C5A5_9BACT|nr:SsrA-binding protein SmpB [Mangrovibacterium marinum]PTN10084.1 SsrA-binding protein [Mangrovibacterium marinum]